MRSVGCREKESDLVLVDGRFGNHLRQLLVIGEGRVGIAGGEMLAGGSFQLLHCLRGHREGGKKQQGDARPHAIYFSCVAES